MHHKVCHCTWKACFLCYKGRKFHLRKYSVGQILPILQSGLDQYFDLKGQIFFLILSQRLVVPHSLMKAFVQGVIHI